MVAEPALWTPEDVARYLSVPEATLAKWRSQGDGPPFYRIGKYVRYKPDDVRDWVETRKAERAS